MFFYAVFALAIMLPRRNAVFAVTTLFALLVALGLLVRLPQPFAFWFSPIILEFCFGMLIALAWRDGWRLPRWASLLLIAAALAAYAASAVWGPFVAWRALEWGVPGAMLVAALALAKETPAPGPVARAFVFLGDASYSLYLVHAIVIPARAPADAGARHAADAVALRAGADRRLDRGGVPVVPVVRAADHPRAAALDRAFGAALMRIGACTAYAGSRGEERGSTTCAVKRKSA